MKSKNTSLMILTVAVMLLADCSAKSQTDAGKIQPPVTNQTGNQNRPATKTESAKPEVGWKTETIAALGVRSIDFPENLAVEKKETKENVKAFNDPKQTYTSFNLTVERQSGKAKTGEIQAVVMIAKYNQDEAWLDYRDNKETVEQKIAKLVERNRELKETQKERFIKADFQTVDEVNGSLYLVGSANNRQMLEWKTFQNVENKLQMVEVLVFYPAGEAQTAMKILNSLRFIK